MGEFIEPGTHRSINIKVFRKKLKVYFSYRIESKDFIYTFFLSAQLNRTLSDLIIIDMK